MNDLFDKYIIYNNIVSMLTNYIIISGNVVKSEYEFSFLSQYILRNKPYTFHEFETKYVICLVGG